MHDRMGLQRHTLGIALLMAVVILWTTSNFLASSIFADATFSKPFFMTYLNTSSFTISLLPTVGSRVYRMWRAGQFTNSRSLRDLLDKFDAHSYDEGVDAKQGASAAASRYRDVEALSAPPQPPLRPPSSGSSVKTPLLAKSAVKYASSAASVSSAEDVQVGVMIEQRKLGVAETANIAFQFCLLWFAANYFAFACLQYTTVSSTTILNSTSGMWTLLFGALGHVESFTAKKFGGVLISLAGIVCISRVDLSGTPAADDAGGPGSSFPSKSAGEMALGDAMAAFSAMLYGVYTVVMKRQVGDESRVNMTLFFGLVGLINALVLWPGFLLLHYTGVEPFEMPATARIWLILLFNAVVSLVSDIAWAYAMLLTTPLVVTVGLSLTIPLSLVGQMFIQNQYASFVYWVGAAFVFCSFLIVNHESEAESSGEVPDLSGGEEEAI